MNCHPTTSSFASQVAPFSMDFLDDSPQFDAEEEALKTLVIRKKSGLSFLVHDDEVVQIFLKQIREELETFKGIRSLLLCSFCGAINEIDSFCIFSSSSSSSSSSFLALFVSKFLIVQMDQQNIFTKELSLTDTLSSLSVPSDAPEFFRCLAGTHGKEFKAIDITGFIWTYQLSTRRTGPYPKPVLLRSSWHPFVVQKGLVPNDRVMFVVEHDQGNGKPSRCTVRAQRKIMRLMGKDLWVDVENLHHYGL
ncbi:hypothetical protein GH714_005206 [Hevea brasiliensis]|uniref:TF-B3 domain-containing protein n=1 Tax=Hevea brasiliensis TaxID=3981 RepID=A0A6A6KXW1_HEVBR|nr:hypothetical protein GH714_005206 [Hevea brasiliensis]